MAKAIFCVAMTENQAELLVAQLRQAGVSHDELTTPLLTFPSADSPEAAPARTKMPQGAAGGARMGAALGSAFGLGISVGWLSGTGVLLVPDGISLVAASPTLSALIAALFGAVLGCLAGSLIGMGIPQNKGDASATADRQMVPAELSPPEVQDRY